MRVSVQDLPCYRMYPTSSKNTTFWLRTEESLPLVGDVLPGMRSEVLYTSNHARFTNLLVGKRSVAYVLNLKPKGRLPRVLYRDWYVMAFYGSTMGALRVLYQDQMVRLISGGNYNAYILIFLKRGRCSSDEIESSQLLSESSFMFKTLG